MSTYGTDKGESGYLPHYVRHLGPRRLEVRSVLEIGIGGDDDPTAGGGSLQLWQDYFPNAHILGLDVERKDLALGDRVKIVQGDQGDSVLLIELSSLYGPFDLVIDDGSHLGRHQRASFETLLPTMAAGSYYVIEDLYPSYWGSWEGGPPGTPGTGIAFVKELVDRLHLGPDPIAAINLYWNIAFIQKGAQPPPRPKEPPPRTH